MKVDCYLSYMLIFHHEKKRRARPLLQSQPTDKPVTGNEYIPGNILDELRDLLKIREWKMHSKKS